MKRPIIRKNDKIYGEISATFSDDGEDVAIITGAGGGGKCLRYFFIVSSADGEYFSIDQKRLISQIFAKIAKISDAKIENNNFHNQYILTSVLSSRRVPRRSARI